MPPPSYRVEAYEKYFDTVTKVQDPLTGPERRLLVNSTKRVLERLGERPDFFDIIARCQRNEKLSMSGSADLFSTKKEGGKLSSAHLLLLENLPIKIVNLEDGSCTGDSITRESILCGDRTIGDALLHLSFDRFQRAKSKGIGSDPNLFVVQPVAIADQGKYRVATKSHPLHAFLLQPFAQTAKALLSCLESTRASMGKQFHMWEFYKRIKPDMVDTVRQKDAFLQKENTFYCSDWEKATDETRRESCFLIIREMGRALGIPTAYLELCLWALVSPRVNILNPKEETGRCPKHFVSTNGVLMGDPVVKNCLQLIHVISREAATDVLERLSEKSVTINPLKIDKSPARKFSLNQPKIFGGPEGWKGGFLKETRPTSSARVLGNSVILSYPLIAKKAREEGGEVESEVKAYLDQHFGRTLKTGLLQELGFFTRRESGA
jgi:hypothetical protein